MIIVLSVISFDEWFTNKHLIWRYGRHIYTVIICVLSSSHGSKIIRQAFSSISWQNRVWKETEHVFITTSNLIMSMIEISVCEHGIDVTIEQLYLWHSSISPATCRWECKHTSRNRPQLTGVVLFIHSHDRWDWWGWKILGIQSTSYKFPSINKI